MLRLRIACLTAALGFICAAPASAQFTPAGHAQESEFNELLDTVYNGLSSELNRALRVPRPINLSSGECGVPNAFFIPAQPEQADAIVLCTELLRAIAGDIARRNLGETLGLYAFTSQTLFILMHEVGHALVQVLDLPAVGQEEDAADQLATLFMVNEPMLAMWAAEFFGSGLASRQTAGSGFADAHDFGPQRYFNILCWTFGADPDTRAYIVGASRLPPERTATCAAEFSRMRGAWERLLEPHLEDPSAFDELDSVRNASGHWRFTETIESDELSIRCTASGTLALWQYSSDLAGTMRQEGTCLVQNVPTDNSGEGLISSGEVADGEITFLTENCTYSGAYEDDEMMAMEGTVSCEVGEGQVIEGTWRAVR
jgi:hypothetical protein